MSEPFRVSRKGGLLRLTLDTPGSRVNILDEAAVRQILEVAASLDPARERAVAVDSAKPDSWLNGARLLALYSVHRPEDAGRLSEGVRQAYDAVEASPVPWIAAVRGSCFGCGVEFALRCAWRVAADTWDTQFYMTEVGDYLVLPGYGGLRLLPGRVGWKGAVDLLLRFQRWRPAEALRRGLVDAVFPAEGFDAAVEAFVGNPRTVRRVRPGEVPVDEVPPLYRDLYEDALSVMKAGRGALDLEAACVARAASHPRVKAATSSFMLRQMAEAVCLGSEPPGPPGLPAGSFRDLQVARLGPLAVREDLRVATRLQARPVQGTCLYLPTGDRVFELTGSSAEDRGLYRHLGRLGYVGVLSRPASVFVLDQFLRAFLAPQAAWCARGGSPDDVDATLREAGFLRRSLKLDRRRLRALVGPLPQGSWRAGAPSAELLEALWLSLAGCAFGVLERGELAHPSCADLVARELLDFPLHLGSLGTHLTPSLLAGFADSDLVPPDLLAAARGRSRGLYR